MESKQDVLNELIAAYNDVSEFAADAGYLGDSITDIDWLQRYQDAQDSHQKVYVVLCSEDYRDSQWIDGVFRTREEAESRVNYIMSINYTDGWNSEEDSWYVETDAEVMEAYL